MLHPSRAGLSFLMLLIAPCLIRADPPSLTSSAPLGVQRGEATEVSFRGTGLVDGPRLVAPFEFQLDETAGSDPEAKGWKVRMVVDPRTPVGVYPIRVMTEAGVSEPILFAVGQLPQVTEVEPNNTLATAQPIPSPVVVEGECLGNDLDFYRFSGRRGERVVVDALCARVGSEVDPMIRLTTAAGRLLASADDTPGLVTDGYLTAVLPEDGEYVLEFGDSRFAAEGRTAYRLLVGAVPFASEVHPFSLPRGQNTALELRGGTLSTDCLFALRTPADPMLAMYSPSIPARLLGDPAWADSDLDVEFPTPVLLGSSVIVSEPTDLALPLPPLTPPVTILGRISNAGERDEFTITAPPGSKHEVRVEAWALGSALDGQLRVYGVDGGLLGESDDGKPAAGRRPGGGGGGGRRRGPSSPDPAFDLTIPDGQNEVKLLVKDLADRGGVGFNYRLVVEPAAPSFQLTLGDGQINVPRGGLALIPVTVVRAGYDGLIALDIPDVPAGSGMTVLPGTVPDGQASGLVGLRAESEGEYPASEFRVVGVAEDGRTIAATGTTVFAQQTIKTPGFGMSGTIPSYARPMLGLTAAVARPGAIQLGPATSTLVLPRGGTVSVPIQIARTDEEATCKLVALSPPAGLTVAELEVKAGETAAEVQVSAAADAAPGTFRLGLVAQPAKGDGPPIAAALIDIEVVHPATVELSTDEVAIEPGGAVEITGKVSRVAPFAEKATVKVEGLPAGVTAEPVEVAADASEFTVTLRAADDAAPAEAQIHAVLSFELGGKAETVAGSPRGFRVLNQGDVEAGR